MPSLAPIPCAAAASLVPLYEERTELRAVTDAVLEGRLGAAVADRAAGPRVARLDIGCYSIFGGDPALPASRELVRTVASPRELLFPDCDAWRARLREVLGTGLSERPMRAFDAAGLDPERLRALAREVPPDFELHEIDPGIAARLGPEHEPHAMQVFDSPQAFARSGIGFCALHSGEIACVASSYAVCSARIELAIATHPTYRRRGLARVVASRLMAECLTRGIVPQWNAGNPVSQHLAVSLGYRPAGICEILYLAH
jgi:GNAT superfamily N-acetyltransferase